MSTQLDSRKKRNLEKSTLRNKHLIFIQTFTQSCCRFYNTMMLMHTSLVFLTIMVQKTAMISTLQKYFPSEVQYTNKRRECSSGWPFPKKWMRIHFFVCSWKKVAFVPGNPFHETETRKYTASQLFEFRSWKNWRRNTKNGRGICEDAGTKPCSLKNYQISYVSSSWYKRSLSPHHLLPQTPVVFNGTLLTVRDGTLRHLFSHQPQEYNFYGTPLFIFAVRRLLPESWSVRVVPPRVHAWSHFSTADFRWSAWYFRKRGMVSFIVSIACQFFRSLFWSCWGIGAFLAECVTCSYSALPRAWCRSSMGIERYQLSRNRFAIDVSQNKF